MIHLFDGHWYVASKLPVDMPMEDVAVDRQGRPIMVYDRGHDAFVYQNKAGHDLIVEQGGEPRAVRIPVAQFTDLEPLIEADDLPQNRRHDLPPGARLVPDEELPPGYLSS